MGASRESTASSCCSALARRSSGSVAFRESCGLVAHITPLPLRFGSTLEECHQYFLGEQHRFTEMAGQSAMETLTLDNDGEIDDVLDRAHDFWQLLDGTPCAASNAR